MYKYWLLKREISENSKHFFHHNKTCIFLADKGSPPPHSGHVGRLPLCYFISTLHNVVFYSHEISTVETQFRFLCGYNIENWIFFGWKTLYQKRKFYQHFFKMYKKLKPSRYFWKLKDIKKNYLWLRWVNNKQNWCL